MTREDVIRGLACCLSAWRHCDKCPYKPPRCAELLTDAMALLEASEPDETRLVRHYTRPNVYADLWLHCEKCGGVVDDRYRPTFCPNCGRGVKWQ